MSMQRHEVVSTLYKHHDVAAMLVQRCNDINAMYKRHDVNATLYKRPGPSCSKRR